MQPKSFLGVLLAMLTLMPAAMSAACDLNSAGNTVFSSNITCEGGMGNTTGNITINDGVAVEFRGATINFTGINQTIFVEGSLLVNRSRIDHVQPTSVEGWFIQTANSDAPLRILKSAADGMGVIIVRKSGSEINGLQINGWAAKGGYAYGSYMGFRYQAGISAFRNITSLTFNNITFNAVKRPNTYGILLNRTSGVRLTNLVMSSTNRSAAVYLVTDGLSNFTSYENITAYSGGAIPYAPNSFQSVNDYPRWKNISIRNVKIMNGSLFPITHIGGGNIYWKTLNNITIKNVIARKNISAVDGAYMWVVSGRMRTANFSCFVRDTVLYDYYYFSSGMKQPYRFTNGNASGIGYCVLVNATAINTTANAYMNYPYIAEGSARFYYYFQPRIAGSAAGGKVPFSGANITIASKRFGLNTSVLTNADGRPYGTANDLLYALNVSAGTINRFRFNVSVTKGAYTNTTQMLINNSNINQSIMLMVPSAVNIYTGFTNRTAIRRDGNFLLNATVTSATSINNESVYARFSNSTWVGSWLKLSNASGSAGVFRRTANMSLKASQYYFVTYNASDNLGNTSALDGSAVWVYDECTINATRPMAYMRFSGVCSGTLAVVGNLTIASGVSMEFRNALLQMTANNQTIRILGTGSVFFNRTTVRKSGATGRQWWYLTEGKNAGVRVKNSYFNSISYGYFTVSRNGDTIDGAYFNSSMTATTQPRISLNRSWNNAIRNVTFSAKLGGSIYADRSRNISVSGAASAAPFTAAAYAPFVSGGLNRSRISNVSVRNGNYLVYILLEDSTPTYLRDVAIENVVGTTKGHYAARRIAAIPIVLYPYYYGSFGRPNDLMKNVLFKNWELRQNLTNASADNHAYFLSDAYYGAIRNVTFEDMRLYDFAYNSSPSGISLMPFHLTATPTDADTDEFVLRNVTAYNTTAGMAVDLPYYGYSGASKRSRFASYWYFQPNITYSNGTAVEGANITLSSKRFGDKSFLTQANGVPYGTSDSLFLGVRVNGTAVTGYRYNVTVLKSGYVSNSTDNILINNSNWGSLGFTLQEIQPKRLIAVMVTPSGNITSLSANFNYAARTDVENAHVAYCNLTKNGTVVRRDMSVANGSAENITYRFGAGDNYRCFGMRVSCATNGSSPTSNSSGEAVICIAQYGLPENNWGMPVLLSMILALGIAAVALFTAFGAGTSDKEATVRAAIGILFLLFALLIAFGA